jgi:hypothetical protein
VQDSFTTQTPLQPFIKLVQGNMALLAQFSLSPEVVSQTLAKAQSSSPRQSGAAGNVTQSNALGQLMQGVLKNYTEFVTELGQSGMTLLAQGQAAMLQQVEDATETAAGAQTRGRRSR